MRLLTIAMLAAALLVPVLHSPASANAGADKMKACAAQWSAMTADQKAGQTYQQFTAKCMAASTAAAAPKFCSGNLSTSCCSGAHGGMATPHVDDGKGYVHCVKDDNYTKAASCKCAS